MKITFNILNQKYGDNVAMATLINMISDLPHKDITPDDFYPGFVVWEVREDQVIEAFSYASAEFWPTIKQVVLLSLGAHTNEVIRHNSKISNIELPVFVKAVNAIETESLPVSWPDSSIDRNSDPDSPADIQQMTLKEWVDSSVRFYDWEPSYKAFQMIKGGHDLSLEALNSLFDWCDNQPALEIELMNLSDFRAYKSQFVTEV